MVELAGQASCTLGIVDRLGGDIEAVHGEHKRGSMMGLVLDLLRCVGDNAFLVQDIVAAAVVAYTLELELAAPEFENLGLELCCLDKLFHLKQAWWLPLWQLELDLEIFSKENWLM